MKGPLLVTLVTMWTSDWHHRFWAVLSVCIGCVLVRTPQDPVSQIQLIWEPQGPLLDSLE